MSGIDVIKPKTVMLVTDGMEVRRTLPTLGRTLIGGWCFIDHYGPEDIGDTGGMQVPPHPHTGLQTVSWLFTGEIEHRDSAGNHALIKRGELNLMTAGRGISHSERSTMSIHTLHGVQLWVALPAAFKNVAPNFEHFVPELTAGDGYSARVFMGTLLGVTSPVHTYSPLVGAQIDLDPNTTLHIDLDPTMEYGFLLDSGSLQLGDVAVTRAELAYVSPGRTGMRLVSGSEGARLVVLGGTPLGEQIVMWWNFIGRSHDDIVGFREQWNGEASGAANTRHFGLPVDDESTPLLAPPLPSLRLRPRG